MYSCSIFQCVTNSRSLPLATVNMVKDYPEMSDWVHSVHYKTPFYVSNNNYTKIAVDRVQAADQRMYNVLLLATGKSCLRKNTILDILSEAAFLLLFLSYHFIVLIFVSQLINVFRRFKEQRAQNILYSVVYSVVPKITTIQIVVCVPFQQILGGSIKS